MKKIINPWGQKSSPSSQPSWGRASAWATLWEGRGREGRGSPSCCPPREQESYLDSEHLRLILVTPGKVLVSKVGVLHVACKVGGTSDFPVSICKRGEPCSWVRAVLSCPVPSHINQPLLCPTCFHEPL